MIQSYVLLGTLGVHSIEDIRERKITVTVTLFSGIVGILLHLLFQNQSIFAMLLGMVPGILLLGLSQMTHGQIGAGDGIVFMLTGFYLGFVENMLLMLLSFTLAGIWGFLLLAAGCCQRRDRIPLIPFLFLGYMGMLLW